MVTNETTNAVTPTRAYSQKLAFYHPNSAGTGAAMQLEPRVNRRQEEKYNCFFLEMAPQKTSAERSSGKFASFDWEHKLTVKLNFTDICELLAVLEDRVEKVGGQRNGLFHQNGQSSTVIGMQKAEKGGYFLNLSKKNGASGDVSRVNMTLSEAEAVGLQSIFRTGLFFITFYQNLFDSRNVGPNAVR